MSQLGERGGHEDDWWRELYDEETPDTGPAAAADTLDDRFASASRTLGPRGTAPGRRTATAEDWTQRAAEEGEWWQGSPGTLGEPPTGPAPEEWPEPTWVPSPRRSASGSTSADGDTPAEPPQASEPEPARVPEARAPEDSRDAADAWAGGEPRPPAQAEYVGAGPPTYEAEPTTLPETDPGDLGDLVPDTVLDGARFAALTLRTASLRGDSARYRGRSRRETVLTARFGSGEQALLLVAVAGGPRCVDGAHRAAADACRWIGAAVGRSHAQLAADIREDRRAALKSGLHRLTDRTCGKLRARAADLGADPAEYTATFRCLLLPADPRCRTRVFFGIGDGGLFRLRGGAWQDLEPPVPDEPDAAGQAQRMPAGPLRFRAAVGRPGDTLLLCSGGLAEPLREEQALAELLAERWAAPAPPGLAAFLADVQLRVKGYSEDRTAAAVWEA